MKNQQEKRQQRKEATKKATATREKKADRGMSLKEQREVLKQEKGKQEDKLKVANEKDKISIKSKITKLQHNRDQLSGEINKALRSY